MPKSKLIMPRVVSLGIFNNKKTWADAKLNRWKVTNEQFKLLSDPQKRMVIAADVVAQLDTKKIEASSGTYLAFARKGYEIVNTETKRSRYGDAREIVSKARAEQNGKCEVCARGSVFLATLDRANSLKISDYWDLERAACGFSYMETYSGFTREQLEALEACFEKWCAWNPGMEDSSRRMRALMINLISNEGKFALHAGAQRATSRDDDDGLDVLAGTYMLRSGAYVDRVDWNE